MYRALKNSSMNNTLLYCESEGYIYFTVFKHQSGKDNYLFYDLTTGEELLPKDLVPNMVIATKKQFEDNRNKIPSRRKFRKNCLNRIKQLSKSGLSGHNFLEVVLSREEKSKKKRNKNRKDRYVEKYNFNAFIKPLRFFDHKLENLELNEVSTNNRNKSSEVH